MRLIKFSELDKRIDKHGVLTVIIDENTVLKISPPEIIVAYTTMLQRIIGGKLCIPTDILNKINDGITLENDEDSTKTPLTEPEITDNIPPVQNELTDEEDALLSFVHQFVNKSSPENTFYASEVRQVAETLTTDQIKELLTQHGYDVAFPDECKVVVGLTNQKGQNNEDPQGNKRRQ